MPSKGQERTPQEPEGPNTEEGSLLPGMTTDKEHGHPNLKYTKNMNDRVGQLWHKLAQNITSVITFY